MLQCSRFSATTSTRNAILQRKYWIFGAIFNFQIFLPMLGWLAKNGFGSASFVTSQVALQYPDLTLYTPFVVWLQK